MNGQTEMMRVVVARRPGGPDVLEIEMRLRPAPAEGEILVRVQAAGVNRPDVLQRMGHYPVPPGASDALGLEVAGEVSRGAQTRPATQRARASWRWSPAAATPTIASSTNATRCRSRPVSRRSRRRPFRRPISRSGPMSSTAAASKPARRCWSMAERPASARPRSLSPRPSAHASSQPRARTTRRAVRTARGRRSGSTIEPRISCERTIAATDGRGADVILDMVGGDYVARNYAAASVDGRIVQIAYMHGQTATIDLRPLMQKRLVHTGSTLRPRSPAEKGAIADALEERVWPLLAAGRCRPIIDSVFPLADAASAHRRMESSSHVGKIVLTL